MKERFAYRFKRIIAIVCVFSLVVGIFPLQAFADSVRAGGTNPYTELTLTDLGIENGTYSSSTNGTENTTETLDGVAIEGTYTFSGGMSNSGVHFGAEECVYRGLYMWMEKEGIVFKYRTNVEGTGTFFDVAKVTLANAGVEETFLGKPVKIRITFDFANVSGTTGDVTFGITVNDTYTTAKTLTGVSTEHLKKTMWLEPTSSHSITVQSTVKQQEPIVYTELTLTDLGIENGTYSSSTNGTENTTETLDGVAIEGTYTFSGGMSNSGVHFGAEECVYRGLYMWMEKEGIVFKYRTNVEGTGTFFDVARVTLTNVGVEETFLGKPIKIRITFDFANVSGTTADVTFGITVNDTYTTTKTLSGVSTEHLKKTMWLEPTSSHSITVQSTVKQQEPIVYTEVTPNSLGIANGSYTTPLGGTGDTTKTLDGIAIEGTYTFSGGMSNSGVHFGAEEGVYRGLYMWMEKEGIVFKYRTNVEGTGTFFDVARVTLTNVGVEETFLGKPIKIRITFDFANVSGTTADVTFGITVNDTYTTTKTLSGVSTEHLKKTMWLNPTGSHSITVESAGVEPGGSGQPGEQEQPDTTVYTELKLEDLGIADGTLAGKSFQTPNSTKTLENVAITGVYNATGVNEIYFGGNYEGLFITFLENGNLRVRYMDVDKKPYSLGEIKPSDVGRDKFQGEDVKIRASFAFSEKTDDEKFATVRFGVQIDNDHTFYYTRKNVALETMERLVLITSSKSPENSTISFRSRDQKDGEIDDSMYELFTMVDFLTYEPGTTNRNRVWSLPNTSLDKVAFEGNINLQKDFSGNSVGFAIGKDYGGIRVITNGTNQDAVHVYYGDDERTQFLGSIKPEDVGLETIRGENIHYRISFTFSETTETTTRLRVAISLNNSEKIYYTVKDAKLTYLQKSLFLLSNGATIVHSSVPKEIALDPIIFEEFGFTKNWFQELGLKIKKALNL